ncbi:hypothetical protein BJ742DRAFT_311385 [Cladochytrium replicatum]|nr:hypothetical protein BJ742DRAFT_311385 [Cladochytrium replicatum]
MDAETVEDEIRVHHIVRDCSDLVIFLSSQLSLHNLNAQLKSGDLLLVRNAQKVNSKRVLARVVDKFPGFPYAVETPVVGMISEPETVRTGVSLSLAYAISLDQLPCVITAHKHFTKIPSIEQATIHFWWHRAPELSDALFDESVVHNRVIHIPWKQRIVGLKAVQIQLQNRPLVRSDDVSEIVFGRLGVSTVIEGVCVHPPHVSRPRNRDTQRGHNDFPVNFASLRDLVPRIQTFLDSKMPQTKVDESNRRLLSMLIEGPTGVGKSMVARTIAERSGVTYFLVRCADLLQKRVHLTFR